MLKNHEMWLLGIFLPPTFLFRMVSNGKKTKQTIVLIISELCLFFFLYFMLYLSCCRQIFTVFLFVREVIKLFTTLGKTLKIQNMLTYRKNLQCSVQVPSLGMFGECWDGIFIHRIFRCNLYSVLFIFFSSTEWTLPWSKKL